MFVVSLNTHHTHTPQDLNSFPCVTNFYYNKNCVDDVKLFTDSTRTILTTLKLYVWLVIIKIKFLSFGRENLILIVIYESLIEPSKT